MLWLAPHTPPSFTHKTERLLAWCAQAIVFVVDAADLDNVPMAQRELHSLLEKPSLKVGLELRGRVCTGDGMYGT